MNEEALDLLELLYLNRFSENDAGYRCQVDLGKAGETVRLLLNKAGRL